MSSRNEKGVISVVVLVIVLLITAGVGGYIYKFGFKMPFPKSPTAASPAEVVQVDPKETDGWQSYLIKYGQIRVKYPQNWLIKDNQSPMSGIRYIDFMYSKEPGVISGDYILNVSIGKSSELSGNYQGLEKNFTIPSLGGTNNSVYSQYSGSPSIYFEKDGVGYTVSMHTEAALREGIDPGEAVNILTKMARSVTFEQVADSCDSPVLKPLITFPSSFILVNRHLSDGKDVAKSYWPQIEQTGAVPPPPLISPEQMELDKSLGVEDAGDPSHTTNIDVKRLRFFAVAYQKSGEPFPESAEFRKGVVQVEGGSNVTDLETATGLFNVNCPELTGKEILNDIYRIDHKGNEPFALEVYGKSSNATNLWGAKEWSTTLLKKTRNEVYVKRGETWQKYTAKDYYVTY